MNIDLDNNKFDVMEYIIEYGYGVEERVGISVLLDDSAVLSLSGESKSCQFSCVYTLISKSSLPENFCLVESIEDFLPSTWKKFYIISDYINKALITLSLKRVFGDRFELLH